MHRHCKKNFNHKLVGYWDNCATCLICEKSPLWVSLHRHSVVNLMMMILGLFIIPPCLINMSQFAIVKPVQSGTFPGSWALIGVLKTVEEGDWMWLGLHRGMDVGRGWQGRTVYPFTLQKCLLAIWDVGTSVRLSACGYLPFRRDPRRRNNSNKALLELREDNPPKWREHVSANRDWWTRCDTAIEALNGH